MEAPTEYLSVIDNIAMMIGLEQVIKIPVFRTSNNGEVAQYMEASSTAHTETQSISDSTWTKQHR
jgi:hypothetical protein